MSYFCDICLRDYKKKNKYSLLNSKTHKEFEKNKHISLSLKNVGNKDVDEILYLYMKDHYKKFNHYLIKGEFKLVFNNNQDCKKIMTGMVDNRAFMSRSNCLREASDSLKTEGYVFSHIAEMDIITLAHKRHMTYDFYLKHNMPAFEWKLNAMINKGINLIDKFTRNWRHPNNTKFDCYRNIII